MLRPVGHEVLTVLLIRSGCVLQLHDDLFVENLERHGRGEPLHGIVDVAAGF